MSERIKKLMQMSGLLLLAGLLWTGISVQNSLARPSGVIGELTDPDRNSVWLFAYNADVVAHEAGDVVVYYDGTTADGLEVTTTTTANNGLVAGVVPAGTTLAASSWGWIQTHGYHSGITIGVANSAGDSLVTSTTGEAAGIYTIAQATGAAANEAAIFGVLGRALEATTASTTVKGFIQL